VNTPPSLTVQVHDAIDSLRSDWEALADAVKAPPFLRAGWFELWLRAFGAGETRLLAVSKGDILVGVLPLVHRGQAITSMANDHTPVFDLLAQDDDAALELSEALLALRPRSVVLEYLEGEGRGLRSVRQAADAAGYRLVIRDWERPPFVALDGGWESYERSLDGKLRRDLARRARRLAEEGAVTFEFRDGAGELDELLEEGFALEPSGWKASRGTAIVSQPETREFYTGLARWAADRGILQLSFLRLDEQPLAFQFGLEDSGVYYFVKGGYDPAFSRYAPMKLLLRRMLESAFSKGLNRFEFLGPPEPFKLEWTSTCHDLKRVELFDRSIPATGAWAAAAFGHPAAKKVKALIRQSRRRLQK
jgi:CelD/BcsL family acetyltransferase involved in cellulose biosynthesis